MTQKGKEGRVRASVSPRSDVTLHLYSSADILYYVRATTVRHDVTMYAPLYTGGA